MRLRRLLWAASSLALVLLLGSNAWSQDADGDTIEDAIDNCRFAPNLLQTDAGGLDGAPSDGIGDACQCGDVGDEDGIVSIADLVVMRRIANSLTPPFANLPKCSVVGGANDCNAADVVRLRAALAAQPGQYLEQVCHADTGGASGLRAYDGNQQIVLVWDEPKVEVARYRVYGSTTPGGPYTELLQSAAQPISGTSVRVDEVEGSPLVNGTFYSFVVTAEDPSGSEGPYSVEVTERAWWDGATTFTASTIAVGTSVVWELSRSPYTLTSSLTVSGTLTIEPGVEVRVPSGGRIVTPTSAPTPAPRLEWLGAGAARIVFDGVSSSPWEGIKLRDGIQGTSIVQYLTVKNAGSGGSPSAAVYLEESPLLFESIWLESPSGPGLRLARGGNQVLAPDEGPTLRGWEISAASGFYALEVTNSGVVALIESSTIRGGVLVNFNPLGNYWTRRPHFRDLTCLDYDTSQHLPHRFHPQLLQGFLDATQFENRDANSPIEVLTGTLEADAHWTAGIYDIVGTVGPSNLLVRAYSRFILDPGTTLRFAENTGLGIKLGSSSAASFFAIGTSADKIVMTTSPGASTWRGLKIHESSGSQYLPSYLDHVRIENTGTGGEPGLRLSGASSESTFKNVEIVNPEGPGLAIFGGDPQLTGFDIESDPANFAVVFEQSGGDVTISASTIRGGIQQPFDTSADIRIIDNEIPDYDSGRPFQLHPNFVGRILSQNVISGTSSGSKVELVNGRVQQDAIWPPFRYEVTGGLQVWGVEDPHLVLSPGTTIAFEPSALPSIKSTLEVGTIAQDGRLTAVGTPSERILLTSLSGGVPGSWEGVRVRAAASDLTRFEYVDVEHAGAGSSPASVLVEDSGPTIASSEIRLGLGDSIRCTGSALPTVRDTSILGSVESQSDPDADGIECSAPAQILRNTISGHGGAGVHVTTATPRLRLRNNTLISNVGGGVVNDDTSGVDARLNWWGDGTDPSPFKSGVVLQNPWLTSAYVGPHETLELGVSPSAFAPVTAEALIRGQFASTVDWNLDILTPPSNASYSGQGTSLEALWDGTDGAQPPVSQADGTYRFELTATDTASALPLTPIAGVISVNDELLRAQIDAPADLAMVSGSSVSVTGTAQGATFQSYTLDYAPGANPDVADFVSIPVGAPPPAPGTATGATLGTWSLSGLQAGIYTLRLQVQGSGASDDSEDRAVVRILDASALVVSPALISPQNADGVLDSAELHGEVSSGAAWTFRILGGSTVVREITGTGRPTTVVWDGQDSVGFVGDGVYSVELEVQDPYGSGTVTTVAASSITVDNTPPTIAIDSPAPGLAILDFSTDIDVSGTVTDDHDCDYTLSIESISSPGESVASVAGLSCGLVSAPLGSFPRDLAVDPTYASGAYNLVLESRDEVGNVSTVTQSLSVDRIEISSGEAVPQMIDPYEGLSASISYTLNRSADVTVRLYRSGSMGAGLVRTFTPGTQGPGTFQVDWDGTGDLGQVLERGAYYFSIEASDAGGRSTVFNDPADPEMDDAVTDPFHVGEYFLQSNVTDAYRNERMEFVYFHYRAPALVDIRIRESGSGPDVEVLHHEPTLPGPVWVRWDGRRADLLESIYNGTYVIEYDSAPVERRLVFLRPPEVGLGDVRTEPFLFQPTHHHVTTIRFDLPRDSRVTIEVKDPSKNPVRTLVDDLYLRAGSFDGFEWDGTDEDGFLVSDPGAYQIELTVTDVATGLVAEPRLGSVMVFP